MPEEKKAEEKKSEKSQENARRGIQPDPLSDRLIPDPNKPDVRRLTGFLLGRSQTEDHWRLYMSANLDHYIEFKKEDLIDAEQLRPSRTVVWLRPEARVHETKTRSVPVEFLQGEIRNGFLRGTIGVPRIFAAMAEGCPGSGCAHCSVACSQLPG